MEGIYKPQNHLYHKDGNLVIDQAFSKRYRFIRYPTGNWALLYKWWGTCAVSFDDNGLAIVARPWGQSRKLPQHPPYMGLPILYRSSNDEYKRRCQPRLIDGKIRGSIGTVVGTGCYKW